MSSAYRSDAHADQVRQWCSAVLVRWTVPHESYTIDTRRGQTHVVSVGAGDRICIYVPGTNFNAATSTTLLAALATTCRVYTADLPGQPGLSTATRPDQGLPGYAAWIADLIAWVRDRHVGANIVLAGHSLGAAVVLEANPHSVQGLALLSPAGLSQIRPSLHLVRSGVPWLVRRNNAGSRRLLDYLSGRGRAPADQLVRWMTLVAQACRTTRAPGLVPDAQLIGWRGRNVRVAVGEHDAFFPFDKLRQPCRDKLGVEATVVPGAGHLLVDEEPKLVTDLINNLF